MPANYNHPLYDAAWEAEQRRRYKCGLGPAIVQVTTTVCRVFDFTRED